MSTFVTAAGDSSGDVCAADCIGVSMLLIEFMLIFRAGRFLALGPAFWGAIP